MINFNNRNLFNYLYEVKVATAKQINRDVFNKVGKASVYGRLKRMIKKKYIQRISFFDGKRHLSGYSLSKSGLRKFIFGKKSEDEWIIKRCLSDSVEHDLILCDIRHLFLSLKKVRDYITENVLRSTADFVRTDEFKPFRQESCDGVVILQGKDQVFYLAVEYEHTLKYIPRYEDLIRSYHLEDDIDGIFFICKDKRILKKVTELEKKQTFIRKGNFYFTTLENLFSNPKCLVFFDHDGKRKLSLT